MRILVTGGAGFIGSALVRYLASDVGSEVLNVDKLTYAGNLASLKSIESAPNYRFLRADICDRARMQEAFGTFRPDMVMHFAAESHVDRSISGAADFVQTNVVGTYTLLAVVRHYWDGLEARRKSVFRFLHVSTDEVYGSLGKGGSLRRADVLRSVFAVFGFQGRKRSSGNRLAPHLRAAGRRLQLLQQLWPLPLSGKAHSADDPECAGGQALPVYGDGANIRDRLYVEHHARALFTIASRGRLGEKYDVGGRNERRNIDVVHRICAIFDGICEDKAPHAHLITHVTDRPGHNARYAIDASKPEGDLGWKAQETFETGIEKTVHWYLDSACWWRPLRENVYAGERLSIFKEK